jgi:hypothetical protein
MKGFWAIWAGMLLLNFLVGGGIVWAAIHFIHKLW